jgi:biliverdin reductase
MRVGLVGTGYAAKLRAEALNTEPRTELVAVAGRQWERTQALGQAYGAEPEIHWQTLVERPDLDLVVIATLNQAHAEIAQAALSAGKHVIVEYPLALNLADGERAIALAQTQNKLLHVEHIELLGGVHRSLKASLPLIGQPFFAQYTTLKPERPAPQRWSYNQDQFGFPLVGALSRLHRLVDAFGEVASVSCQGQFWPRATASDPADFVACLCTAHLHFRSGVLGQVVYGKGETIWQATRTCQVWGAAGALLFEGDRGSHLHSNGSTPLEIGARRGLFTQDTALVLDHLLTGAPLYISPERSLYSLKIALAAQQSALQQGAVIPIS